MKKIHLTLAALGLATSVFGQATVSFNNTVGATGLIMDQSLGTPLAAGVQVTVQLLYGPVGTPVEYLIALTPPFTLTLVIPGKFSDPTPKILPGIEPGDTVTLAVQCWTGAWPDILTAAANGASIGRTLPFNNPTGGGYPPTQPAPLIGWQSNNGIFIINGGALKWGASTGGAYQAWHFYLFKVALPPEAVAYGAAWKVPGTSYSSDYTNWYAPSGLSITNLPIEFRQAAGYATPPTVVTNLQSSPIFENNVQITIVPADYILLPRPVLTNLRLADNDRLAMTLQGVSNRVYSLQFCTNLANWSPVSFLTNTASGTLTFTNSPLAGCTRGFYRVKEGTD